MHRNVRVRRVRGVGLQTVKCGVTDDEVWGLKNMNEVIEIFSACSKGSSRFMCHI